MKRLFAFLLFIFIQSLGLLYAFPAGISARSVAIATDNFAELAKPNFRVYTEKDGIPKNSVTSLMFDHRGYLWIGTLYGAAYYNGRKWITVNMPNRTISNLVNNLAETSDGSIWFGTMGNGVHRLKDGKWTTFNLKSGALPHDFVRRFLITKDHDGKEILWVGTNLGLVKFKDEQWTTFNKDNSPLPGNRVTDLIESNNAQHTMWIGTTGGLAKLENDQWTTFTPKNSGISSEQISCLLETVNNKGRRKLWVGTDEGLNTFEDNRWRVYTIKNSAIPGDPIESLLESVDSNGRSTIWMGIVQVGLVKYENDKWQLYNTKNTNLPNNDIYSCLETKRADGQRTLWLATFGGGLARLEDNQWTYFDTKTSPLPNNSIYKLYQTKAKDGTKTLWLCTAGGLVKYENGQWTIYDTQNSKICSNYINAIYEQIDSNNEKILWVATAQGLCKLERGQWTTFDSKTSALPSDSIMYFEPDFDNDGHLFFWLGTFGGGLVKFEPEANRWTSFNTKNSGIPGDSVYCLRITKDANGKKVLWVGVYGSGLAKFQDGQWTTFNTANSSLPSNYVTTINEIVDADGKRSLWVGTYNAGLAYFKLDAINEKWTVMSEETPVPLPNNVVNAVIKDNQQRIYICTLKGILRLTPRNANAFYPQDYETYTFTTDDGLPSNEINGDAVLIDDNNYIWVGTFSGVGVLDLSKAIADKTTKPLILERTLVNGKVFRKDDRDSNNSDRDTNLASIFGDSLNKQILAYDQNSITLEYALLSYLREKETLYQTQLIGVDDRTSEWVPDSKQSFYNLAAGNYIFKVWGKDYAGNITGPIELSFQIKPAPWFTWWAYLCYLSLLIVCIYFSTKTYMSSLEQKNQQLEVRIKERTNTIAQQKEHLSKKNEELIHSEKRALDSERKAVEANRAKSTFLANMNHELRTPLNAILGFVQLMEREPHRSRPDKEKLSVIMNSGEHLLGLINDVLSISKIEAGQITLNKQHFNLSRLLENLAEMFKLRAQTKNLQFEVNYDSSLPKFVNGDEGRLRQVLINLLGNAFKFTDKGKVSLSVSFKDERAYFVVQDSGLGIEQNELSRLFIPFAQTQSGLKAKEGTGLGLVISKNLINLMDGDITVKSKYGEGSTFSFDINLPEALLAEEIIQERKVISIVPGQEDYRLLIADDVTENRVFLAELLSSVGFRVKQVSNGVEAVQVWEEWHPHLIWMDMRMPVMDGNDATRIIREKEQANNDNKFNRTVIIALTASSFAHDRSTIIANGCDDFVPKPFKINTIFEKLAQRLGIDFIFEEPAIRMAIQGSIEMDHLTPTVLLSLPPELLKELSNSIINGDVEAATKVTEQIKLHDNQIAQSLELMIKSYKFDEILNLMQHNL